MEGKFKQNIDIIWSLYKCSHVAALFSVISMLHHELEHLVWEKTNNQIFNHSIFTMCVCVHKACRLPNAAIIWKQICNRLVGRVWCTLAD